MLAADRRSRPLLGETRPRIGPPLPARSSWKDWEAEAIALGIQPMPWQSYFARIVYAVGPGNVWQFPETCAVVSRQNGKTTFVDPHIVRRMKMGRRVLHAAQLRELPRLTFLRLAAYWDGKDGVTIRRGAGQEQIELDNGGFYKIVAATGGAPRGMSVDDLIIDELREIDEDFIQAAIPTTIASPNPQILYLSNAGTDESVALNAIRQRAGDDPSLAYLEWSAHPSRAIDDVDGWREANPALGHRLQLPTIERTFRAAKLAGTLAAFETEHLCRWVATMRERLVDDYSWVRCKGDTGTRQRPVIGVSMDPHGSRASVAIAWRNDDGVSLELHSNVTADPIDTDQFGKDVKALAQSIGATEVAFDPLTDKEVVKYLRKGLVKPVTGQEFAAASAQFVNIVNSEKLRWQGADAVTDDLTWTSRKPTGDGSYHAVRAIDDRAITASLAAIRAVWRASGPVPAVPRVWT